MRKINLLEGLEDTFSPMELGEITAEAFLSWLGLHVREARQEAGVPFNELARRLRVHPDHLDVIERGYYGEDGEPMYVQTLDDIIAHAREIGTEITVTVGNNQWNLLKPGPWKVVAYVAEEGDAEEVD